MKVIEQLTLLLFLYNDAAPIPNQSNTDITVFIDTNVFITSMKLHVIKDRIR